MAPLRRSKRVKISTVRLLDTIQTPSPDQRMALEQKQFGSSTETPSPSRQGIADCVRATAMTVIPNKMCEQMPREITPKYHRDSCFFTTRSRQKDIVSTEVQKGAKDRKVKTVSAAKKFRDAKPTCHPIFNAEILSPSAPSVAVQGMGYAEETKVWSELRIQEKARNAQYACQTTAKTEMPAMRLSIAAENNAIGTGHTSSANQIGADKEKARQSKGQFVLETKKGCKTIPESETVPNTVQIQSVTQQCIETDAATGNTKESKKLSAPESKAYKTKAASQVLLKTIETRSATKRTIASVTVNDDADQGKDQSVVEPKKICKTKPAMEHVPNIVRTRSFSREIIATGAYKDNAGKTELPSPKTNDYKTNATCQILSHDVHTPSVLLAVASVMVNDDADQSKDQSVAEPKKVCKTKSTMEHVPNIVQTRSVTRQSIATDAADKDNAEGSNELPSSEANVYKTNAASQTMSHDVHIRSATCRTIASVTVNDDGDQSKAQSVQQPKNHCKMKSTDEPVPTTVQTRSATLQSIATDAAKDNTEESKEQPSPETNVCTGNATSQVISNTVQTRSATRRTIARPETRQSIATDAVKDNIEESNELPSAETNVCKTNATSKVISDDVPTRSALRQTIASVTVDDNANQSTAQHVLEPRKVFEIKSKTFQIRSVTGKSIATDAAKDDTNVSREQSAPESKVYETNVASQNISNTVRNLAATRRSTGVVPVTNKTDESKSTPEPKSVCKTHRGSQAISNTVHTFSATHQRIASIAIENDVGVSEIQITPIRATKDAVEIKLKSIPFQKDIHDTAMARHFTVGYTETLSRRPSNFASFSFSHNSAGIGAESEPDQRDLPINNEFLKDLSDPLGPRSAVRRTMLSVTCTAKEWADANKLKRNSAQTEPFKRNTESGKFVPETAQKEHHCNPILPAKRKAEETETLEPQFARKRKKTMSFATFEKDVHIPEHMIDHRLPLMQTVIQYYRRVASYWPTGLITFDTILRPHRYYMEALNFQNDEKPNLIVFCESHALTPDVGDVSCDEALLRVWFGYVNLVHCLPYGESHLLTEENLANLSKAELAGMKKGTINFWKLLSVLAGLQDVDRNKGVIDPLDSNDCFDFLKSCTNTRDRIAAKNDIQLRLKNRRIALVDASLFPIYHGSWKETSHNKTTGQPYYTHMNPLKKQKLDSIHLHVSWEYYAKPLIAHFQPRNVLILSKGLGRQAGKLGSFLRENGEGQYRGARVHPSAPMNMQDRLLELKALRSIALDCLH